ncbi:MAG: Fic family protein [Candidatus Poribacteria bacterium]|nr:Fic family protein [Candidatus Poribacteria bacterium]
MSFTPSFINCRFVWENPEIDVLLEKAERLLAELNSKVDCVPDVESFIKMSVLKEATDSNRIAGTKTEFDDIVLPQEVINPEKRDDWQEAQNYIKAVNFAICKLSKLPLSIRLLKETHEILVADVRGQSRDPGNIRRVQTRIGGSSLSDAFFIPPSPEKIPCLLSDLEKFWHNKCLQIPELIKIAITHYQFETIHPFLDGNGRCGRLLIVLQLIDAKILKVPVLYMSTFFEKHRDSYQESLSMVHESNDLEQWIVFFLYGIGNTAQRELETCKTIIALHEEYEKKILPLRSRVKNAQKLLNFMYSEPTVSVNLVVERFNMSYSTVNRLLKSLTELGVLKETRDRSRNRLFALEKYLNLFRN